MNIKIACREWHEFENKFPESSMEVKHSFNNANGLGIPVE